ncbi:hypothetical protein HMPREF9372_1264 [Sporosarcina newyorkensis 2681]|uniref:DUF5049 domain-containing protein n=1 Tax=Sporosarcina newyorkensis 2681 TaxID=1027292 RepID=F9DR34_9BACL|nr:DUF5049 domain-containing protein [Sporosarcina newyorkensis]EGQ26723.1 hypothetical protein HMPREF9372_1264 [Sporosarcina newyorkensis 2681]
MNPTIKEQLLAIRDSGETNMFDVPVVMAIAFREGYTELLTYIENHKLDYVHFILTGEEKN